MSSVPSLLLAVSLLQEAPVEASLTRSVQVVAATPRVSVSGVDVWIRGAGFSVEGRTDASGRVALGTPGGVARVGCKGEKIWCKVGRVRLNQTVISLPAWNQTVVSGRISVEAQEAMPARVVVQAINSEASGPESIERESAVVDGRYSVLLPSGLTDIRLAVDTFSPNYFWQVELQDGGHDLGSTRLRRGASISGTVIDSKTERPAAGLLVRLIAPGGVPAPARGWIQARTSAKGFFQLQNVPIGQHKVLFLRDDRVVSAIGPLEVPQDSEIRLDSFMLTPPIEFGLTLKPAVAPDGGPWTVQLAPEGPLTVGLPLDLKMVATEEGEVRFTDLMAGTYTLMVSGSGQRILLERIDISADAHETRELPMTRVRGRVRLGNMPIVASLSFSAGAMDQVILTSDEEGRFAGWMKSGKGSVFVTVASQSPRITKNVVLPRARFEEADSELDIRLDDVRVTGRVEFRGKGREGIVIKAQAGQADFVSSTSDKDGAFELRPLSPVPYVVTAFDQNFPRSRPVEFDASRPPERLDIQLVDGRPLRIQVLTPDGAPVAGARVKVDPIGFSASYLYQPTATSGSVQIPVPTDASRLFVRVVSESLGAWSGCISTPAQDTPLTILLPGPPFAYGRLPQHDDRSPDVLVSLDGAAWSLEDLILWPRSLRGSDREMLGLTPGPYAVLSSSEPWERFIARWCTAGPPHGLTWSPVLIGGPAAIGFGLKVP